MTQDGQMISMVTGKLLVSHDINPKDRVCWLQCDTLLGDENCTKMFIVNLCILIVKNTLINWLTVLLNLIVFLET